LSINNGEIAFTVQVCRGNIPERSVSDVLNRCALLEIC